MSINFLLLKRKLFMNIDKTRNLMILRRIFLTFLVSNCHKLKFRVKYNICQIILTNN